MGYRQPSFMVSNFWPGTNQALSAIAPRNAGAMTDATKRRLVDYRPRELAAIAATGTNAGFILDMGGPNVASAANRAVISAGHTLATRTVEVAHSTASDLSSNTVSGSVVVPSGSTAVVDIDCSVAGIGRRYWGLQIANSVNAVTYSLGEFWLGQRRTLTADAYVNPGWSLEWRHDLVEDDFGGRTATLELSAPRRRFRLDVVNLDPSSADFSLIDEVASLGRSRPFWYWPPDDVIPGPFLVQLSGAAVRRQEFRAPTVAIRYAVALEMVEQAA